MINNLSNIKILIGTPAYNGICCTGYTESLLYTIVLLSQFNIIAHVKFINNQIVTRARNMICSLFMENESYTHLLFIDADIKWNPHDVIKLLNHNLECSIGLYPNKRYFLNNNKFCLNCSSQFEDLSNNNNNNNNLVKITRAATGFMLLKKSALIKIQNSIETFYLPDDNGKNILLYNYFDCNVVNNDYLTEDYYFSYLFIKNGGEIWGDKTIKLIHIGNHNYGELN